MGERLSELLLVLPLAALGACENGRELAQEPSVESAARQSETSDEVVPVADSWESQEYRNSSISECSQIEDALVREVDPSLRGESILALSETQFVALTDEDAVRLIGDEHEGSEGLATSLVSRRLAEMRDRKYRAEVERRDSWSERDQLDFEALTARFEAGSYSEYQPYLVRAVAKHEGTGSFYASLCDNDLHVVHGSLGRDVPPSIRAPVVIFLSRPPERVQVMWQMAG